MQEAAQQTTVRKPSVILQMALDGGHYGTGNRVYMCHSLGAMHSKDLITHDEQMKTGNKVRDYVHAFDPGCCSLWAAMENAGVTPKTHSQEAYMPHGIKAYQDLITQLIKAGF